MKPLNDLFCYAANSLTVNTMDHFKKYNTKPAQRKHMIEDVIKANDWVHISGTMHREVISNPDKQLTKDPLLPQLFTHLKDHNKIPFLITNSSFEFVNNGMQFLLGKEWMQLFKQVVVNAKKPYFQDHDDLHFREVDVESCTLLRNPIEELKSNKVQSGGCLQSLIDMTEIKENNVI